MPYHDLIIGTGFPKPLDQRPERESVADLRTIVNVPSHMPPSNNVSGMSRAAIAQCAWFGSELQNFLYWIKDVAENRLPIIIKATWNKISVPKDDCHLITKEPAVL
jgi:hypothetical protein